MIDTTISIIRRREESEGKGPLRGFHRRMRYDRDMPVHERLKLDSAPVRPPEPDPFAEARKRLIVALDVPDEASAIELVDRLQRVCSWFKVGMELFTAAGPRIVEALAARGHSVFLDLKFCDIPNTVAGGVRSAAALGARLLTVHALGGPAMLEAAQHALSSFKDPPQLLAVTVLTSMDQAQCRAVGFERPPSEQVELLARLGMAAGIRGFVCSPQEVASLRALTGPEGVLVVPGIRPAGSQTGDQKRIATPADALRNGASYLVVGRPITQAGDPAEAAEAILEEMAAAL
jgi:orotidine-5'-phosphate decarboxylase